MHPMSGKITSFLSSQGKMRPPVVCEWLANNYRPTRNKPRSNLLVTALSTIVRLAYIFFPQTSHTRTAQIGHPLEVVTFE